ncbi:M12 family metallo-peptidase [Methanococcoides sp. NM1]|uniref:M12 family metallo-peptidase n=1 Tax=Methanococcoides sp. NM1 TaxID=1201013 RepID=UPI001082719F|nr:M12 family metallo-peptidase [Methanococcoides sp. NM1]
MKTNMKFGIGVILAAMLLVSMAFVPGTAFANGNNPDNLQKIEFDKNSLEFAEILDDFETVTVNPAIFKKSADDGLVKLRLLGKEFDIELQEVSIQSEDAKLVIVNETEQYVMDAPKIHTYEGKIIGDSNSSVLLTVADDVILGKVAVEDKSYYLEQTNKKHNGKVVHVVYVSDAIKKREILEYNTDGTLEQAPLEILPLPEKTTSLSTLSTTTVDLLAGYDTEFSNKFSNPTAEINNMVASANSAFSAANVNLNTKAIYYYSNIQNDDATAVRDNFVSEASSDRDSDNCDLAFLFSGKEFDGSVIGKSMQYTGSSSEAYAVAQMVSPGIFSSYGATYNERCILTAHEIGHNFGATHSEAYKWNIASTTHFTTMWSPFAGTSYPDYMELEFSNINDHGDSSHNNIADIIANKGTVAGFQ